VASRNHSPPLVATFSDAALDGSRRRWASQCGLGLVFGPASGKSRPFARVPEEPVGGQLAACCLWPGAQTRPPGTR